MTRRTVYRLVATTAVVAFLLILTVLSSLWFGPSGTGEFRNSPNGRYTAHASNMSTGTLTGGRDWFIEITVVEESSGREVWRIVRRHQAEAEVPEYGNRAGRYVTWAPDSSTVTVPIEAGQSLVLNVP